MHSRAFCKVVGYASSHMAYGWTALSILFTATDHNRMFFLLPNQQCHSIEGIMMAY